jgi:hypothetical protein
MKTIKSTPLSRRLVRALKAAKVPGLDQPDDQYALLAIHPGHWQKSAGAWAWELAMLGRQTSAGYWPMRIGSPDPASSLRKGSKVSWYSQQLGGGIEVCIDPPKETVEA